MVIIAALDEWQPRQVLTFRSCFLCTLEGFLRDAITAWATALNLDSPSRGSDRTEPTDAGDAPALEPPSAAALRWSGGGLPTMRPGCAVWRLSIAGRRLSVASEEPLCSIQDALSLCGFVSTVTGTTAAPPALASQAAVPPR